MKMGEIEIGKTYRVGWTDRTLVVLEKNIREEGYRGRPRTNVRVRWENGVEVDIPARHLLERVDR